MESGNVVAPGQWTNFTDAVVAFLDYARAHYGAEAEGFSLNEPDAGISIAVASNDYPRAVRQLGRAIREQGLRTRLLLGDVSHPRDSASAYLDQAAADPLALREVGWVSFHSWLGATADEYAAWSELAGRLRLPLVVAEAGVDPDWWRVPAKRHDYAMAEMAQYFAMLE